MYDNFLFLRHGNTMQASEAFVQQQFAEMTGLGLNLKLVLYLQSQCLTENLGFLNPPLLQAAKRYVGLPIPEKYPKYFLK
jgi:hypothetical protein